MKLKPILTGSILAILQITHNSYGVSGKLTQISSSPNGVSEECVVIGEIPGGVYSPDDKKKEEGLCAIDFYAPQIAICPKEKSTSPGTYVYSLENSGLNKEQAQSNCSATDAKGDKLASFKQTMNQADTSGTYYKSSLLYYHLSRYLQTNLYVPVSVYRTMDRKAHLKMVASKGRGESKMNRAGWNWMRTAETNPESYNERKLLFTDDFSKIIGVLLHAKGERYGSYLFGTRESGWFKQYEDFKRAPPQVALMTSANLHESVQKGIAAISKSKQIRKEIGMQDPTPEQMVSWMQDLSEMEVMDYIYSQQDRIGNIDYIWAWAYIEGGKFRFANADKKYKKYTREKMLEAHVIPPPPIAKFNPILIQKTILGDNDAGGLARYDNPTKKFQLLESLRHLNADFYERVQILSNDFNRQGELYSYFLQSFKLQPGDFKAFVANVMSAAKILRDSCEQGRIRFDLDFNDFMVNGGIATEQKVQCSVN